MSTTNPFSTTPAQPPPPSQQQHQIYPNLRPPTAPNPNTAQGILYPVASSGRGFVHRPIRPHSNTADHSVTVANHSGYPPRPNHMVAYHPPPRPHLDVSHHPVHLHHHHHMARSHLNQQHHPHYHHPQISQPIKGIPVSSAHPKVTPSPSPSPVSDSNGYKNMRDKRDDTISVIRDRKVRVLDGASLYALCRSWMRNAVHEENQPQYGDGLKSLPRPLPMAMTDTDMGKKREGEEEGDHKEEDENSVDHLSPQDLLKRHVKRAKRVRSRLREERTKRIERYKTRLGLLLPPLVEQVRNDAAGN